jgi:hypothetical protein
MERVVMRKKSQNTGAVYSTMVAKPFMVNEPSRTRRREIIPWTIKLLAGVPAPSFQTPRKRKRGNSAPSA